MRLPAVNYAGPGDPEIKEISISGGRKVWAGQLITQHAVLDLAFKTKVALYLTGGASSTFTADMAVRRGVVSLGLELSMGFKFDPAKSPVEVKPAPDVAFTIGIKFD